MASLFHKLGLLVVVLSPALSSASTVSYRDFENENLAGLRLKRLDVAISIAGPPRVLGTVFDLPAPAPTTYNSIIWNAAVQDGATAAAVRNAIAARFTKAGFEVSFRLVNSTSTLTVSSVRADSSADAILIVRGISADEFVIDRGVGTKIIETPQGRERVRDYLPETRHGRLIVGQAFLFDRRTGIRLWSRQAPDYPKTKRLRTGHPFLKHGHVGKETGTELANLAAEGFVSGLFVGFPKVQSSESSQARGRINATDLDQEYLTQAFWDKSPLALELGLGWSYGQFALPLTLFDEELPALGSDTITPNGLLRLRPQISFFTNSEWVWNMAIPFVILPERNLQRTYFRDEPKSNIGLNGRDHHADISVNGLFGFGGELSTGPVIVFEKQYLVSPLLGIFIERWQFDVRPGEVLTQDSMLRMGAFLGGDVTYFPGGLDGSLFIRGQGQFRAGLDNSATFLWGLNVTFGAGILL